MRVRVQTADSGGAGSGAAAGQQVDGSIPTRRLAQKTTPRLASRRVASPRSQHRSLPRAETPLLGLGGRGAAAKRLRTRGVSRLVPWGGRSPPKVCKPEQFRPSKPYPKPLC